ncbi:hypothetical protein KQY30_01820 [Streptomyces sp. GMY02]|nr:hypothetical protein [Streptomyces sp. GMY02]QXE33221.1 hypothetical protein KQY30_01820 [Streptomyces sp. GMY02]
MPDQSEDQSSSSQATDASEVSPPPDLSDLEFGSVEEGDELDELPDR